MKVLTAAEMALMDRLAAEQYGVPSLTLMENAGRSVAATARRMTDGRGKVVIFCGKGNNGGDGLVAARLLHESGVDVQVYLLGSFQDLKADPRANLESANRSGVSIRAVTGPGDLNEIAAEADRAALIIDAMLGTGFSPPVHGLTAGAISLLIGLDVPVLAVDIPSGLSADSGAVPEVSLAAATTVTFGLPKIGQLLYPAAARYGRLLLADIGFPAALAEKIPAGRFITLPEEAAALVSPRAADSHKGSFGHVLLVAGSSGLGGAALLAARGALRGGAGLVTIGLPQSLAGTSFGGLPEAMNLPLPEAGRGVISSTAVEVILENLPGKRVLAIGPGLSRHPEAERLVLKLIPEVRCTMVVDADGLNAIAASASVLLDSKADVILTPHPGELARLMGITVPEVQENRVEVSQQFSKKYGVIVLLKGARSIVATPSGETYFNTTGNAGMAAGGMGDVLTGLVSALVAQGSPPAEAVVLGAYLHGCAGDEAAARTGPWGFLAGEVADLLPSVTRDLLSDEVQKNGAGGDLRVLLP